MNTRLATIVSVAGVLLAGSAAALVNAQALGGTGSQGASSLPDLRSATSTSSTASPPSTSVITVEPTSSSHVLAIGDGGTVTVGTANGVLGILAVAPAPGWQVSSATAVGPTEAVIVFASQVGRLRASVELADGAIITMIDRLDPSIDSTTSVPLGAPPSISASVPVTAQTPLPNAAPAATTTSPALPASGGAQPAVVPGSPASAPTTSAPITTQPPTITSSDDDLVSETEHTEPDDDGGYDDD